MKKVENLWMSSGKWRTPCFWLNTLTCSSNNLCNITLLQAMFMDHCFTSVTLKNNHYTHQGWHLPGKWRRSPSFNSKYLHTQVSSARFGSVWIPSVCFLSSAFPAGCLTVMCFPGEIIQVICCPKKSGMEGAFGFRLPHAPVGCSDRMMMMMKMWVARARWLGTFLSER